jgi:hypothetical protein
MAVTITRTAWTDDDGSGTTGTVINNAVKTELYGQIDAVLATVFTSTTELKSTVVTSGLTAVGTITTGVWNAGAITSSGSIKSGAAAAAQTTLDGSSLNARTNSVVSTLYLNDSGGAISFGDAPDMVLSTAGVLTITALASGNLTSASGVITSSSDERMKDILGSLDYGLAKVLELRPVRARWNKLAHELQGLPMDLEFGGFGAAQVEAVMPLAVSYGKDGMRSLHDRVILGAVVNAIRELQHKIVSLRAA